MVSCSNKFDEDGNQIRLSRDSSNVKSVCGGGGEEPKEDESVAYECIDRSPFTDSSGGGDQRYGFAAANSKCCECYGKQLTISSFIVVFSIC